MKATIEGVFHPYAIHNAIVKNWLRTLAAAAVLAIGATANAAFIGHNPTGPWDNTSDGIDVLALQVNNAVSQAATVDSFSFFRGEIAQGIPWNFAALIVRPTGANQYTVIYNSGSIDLTQPPYNTTGIVHTVGITPVAVQAGDIVASWGQGIAYDDTPGFPNDSVYWQGVNSQHAVALPPSAGGTFTTAGGGGATQYSLLTNSRIYALAFNIVPEPSSFVFLGIGGIGLLYLRHRRSSVHR